MTAISYISSVWTR